MNPKQRDFIVSVTLPDGEPGVCTSFSPDMEADAIANTVWKAQHYSHVTLTQGDEVNLEIINNEIVVNKI